MLKKIEKDILKALKDKDTLRLNALRLLKSEIQYEITNKKGEDTLSEDKTFALIKKSIKTDKRASPIMKK